MSAALSATVREIASVLLDYTAFAIFQSVARGQPLAPAAQRFGLGLRVASRLVASGLILAGCDLLAPVMTLGAAMLLATVATTAAAAAFVLLAAVKPGLAWRTAWAAPVVSAVLVLCARALS